MYATLGGHTDVVRALVEANACVNKSNMVCAQQRQRKCWYVLILLIYNPFSMATMRSRWLLREGALPLRRFSYQRAPILTLPPL
jgi:hypothetical protein